jgi:hypothetical protein
MTDESKLLPDTFDKALDSLDGRPDTTKTKPTTIRTMPLLAIGGSVLHIVQTVRQQDKRRDKHGDLVKDKHGNEVTVSKDFVFYECHMADGNYRLVLPPEVVEAIVRQRDALTAKLRSKAAKQAVETRKALGMTPFVKRGGQ